jgi:hypothetical protein
MIPPMETGAYWSSRTISESQEAGYRVSRHRSRRAARRDLPRHRKKGCAISFAPALAQAARAEDRHRGVREIPSIL